MLPSIAHDLLYGKARPRFTTMERGLSEHVRRDADLVGTLQPAPVAGSRGSMTRRLLLDGQRETEHLACEF